MLKLDDKMRKVCVQASKMRESMHSGVVTREEGRRSELGISRKFLILLRQLITCWVEIKVCYGKLINLHV